MNNNTNTNRVNPYPTPDSKPTGNSQNCLTAISVQFHETLLNTLRARHNSRYSRSEAFIDILLRMREIDSPSRNSSEGQQSSQVLNSSSDMQSQSSARQQSLFPEQSKPGGASGAAKQNETPSYSGRPTDEFMSRHCVTNYSQLAAAWHWNRQTVLTFLRSLESAGVILFEQKNKTVEIFI